MLCAMIMIHFAINKLRWSTLSIRRSRIEFPARERGYMKRSVRNIKRHVISYHAKRVSWEACQKWRYPRRMVSSDVTFRTSAIASAVREGRTKDTPEACRWQTLPVSPGLSVDSHTYPYFFQQVNINKRQLTPESTFGYESKIIFGSVPCFDTSFILEKNSPESQGDDKI